MAGFDITTSAGVPLDITATNINLQGQTDFNLPPTAPSPTLGDQVATKGYVDSLVGQYSGGYNLYLNYSQVAPSFPSYKVLTGEISGSVGTTATNTIASGDQIVATFITEPLGLTEVPAGLWDLFVYGVVSSTAGSCHYFFELWREDILGNATSFGTSSISAEINAVGTPNVYSCLLTLAVPQVLALTDRLFVVVKVQKTGAGTVDITTYFEGNYYSFIQTSLNAGTTLLGSDNTWTGNNAFDLDITTPAIYSTTGNLDVGSAGSITTLKGDVTIDSNLFLGTPNSIQLYGGAEDDLYDTTTQNNIQTRVGGNRNEVYNAIISSASSGSGALILPSVSTGYYVNVYNNSSFSWTISSQSGEKIANGLGGAGINSPLGITIKAFQSMSFYQNNGGVGNKINYMCGEVISGTQGQFTSLLVSSSLDTVSSTALTIGGTTATSTTIGRNGVGASTVINGTTTNIAGTTINITGACEVNGAGTLDVPTQGTNTNNTKVASTGWVNNFFGALVGATWTGTQSFVGATLTALTQATNTNDTLVATTGWVNNFFGALAGATWTGAQNFTGATLTALTQLSNTNSTVVATTQWVNTYFGALAGATWAGTHNFTGATLNAFTQLTNTNDTLVATTGWVNTFFGKKNGAVWTGTHNFTGATLNAFTQLTNTNTTVVATTAWVNDFFGALAGAVWTGTQDFTGATLTALTQVTNTDDTKVATTGWVNNFFGELAGAVWSGTQNFTGATLTAFTQLTNTDDTLVATTAWVNNFFGELAGAVWSGTQNFTSATLTALTQATNTNDTLVATTGWTNNFFGLKAGQTWTGTHDFTGATLNAFTQATNTNSTAVATTAWTNTFYAPKASPVFTGNAIFNAIRGDGTTLSIIQPVVPTIAYNAESGTGGISASAIGAATRSTSASPSATIPTTFLNLNNNQVASTGVYMVSGVLRLRNDDVAGTVDRINVNIGYGATGSTNSNIIAYTFGKTQFGATGALGFATDFPFSYVFTVATLGSPNNFVTLSASNDGTSKLILVSIGSTMRVVRIA